MITDSTVQVKLVAWSNRHALIMLTASALLLAFGFAVNALAAIGAVSFAVLISDGRGHWTPDARFGWANGVTLLRLLMVLSLALIGATHALWVILIALLIFLMDAVDGCLARKFGCASEFGEFFDKETDAFFMLLLCWMLYLDQRLGVWILFPGLLRYLFVAFLIIVKPPQYKEPQTATGKYIFAVTVSILIFCFTDYARIYQPLAQMMTLLLCISFADTIRLMYRGGRHETKT